MPNVIKILNGEEDVAGVQQLIAPEVVRPLIEEMLDRPERLRSCALRRVKFKPGRKVTAYYDAVLANPCQNSQLGVGDGSTYPLTITWTHPDQPLKLATEEGQHGQEIRQRGLAGPFQRLVMYQPETNLHIQVSPFDPIYPQLPRLSDPAYLRAHLGEYASMPGEWHVTPIRYRPRQRHVLRYDASSQDAMRHDGAPATQPTKGLFAKLYADDSQSGLCTQSSLYTRTHHLADWLASHQSNAAVLRPLAYLAAESTLLFEEAVGSALSASLVHEDSVSNGHILKRLAQTGAALRQLQQAPDEICADLSPLTIGAECKAIARTCEHIRALLPETWRCIAAVLQRTGERYEALPNEVPTLVHGDFKADHVLVHPQQITLFDLDSCALADPAYDVGKFLADLGWFYGEARAPAYRAACNAFLNGYGLPLSHPRLQRARLWQTLIGIKIVAHRVRIFEHDWAERTAGAVAAYGR